MKYAFLIAGLLAAGAGPATANAADNNTLALGGGVAAGARYSGSDEMQAAPIVAIDYQMANGFYASTVRGLGYGSDFGKLHLNAALGYRGQRTDKEESGFGGRHGSEKLKGMGIVKASATGTVGAAYTITDWLAVSGHAELPLTQRANGGTAGASLTGTLLNSRTDQLTLSVGANFADCKYAQTYYGVTALQSARSGYRKFTPKAGLHEGVISVAWQHQVGGHWFVHAMAGYSILLGDARDSPLTQKSATPAVALYASYRY